MSIALLVAFLVFGAIQGALLLLIDHRMGACQRDMADGLARVEVLLRARNGRIRQSLRGGEGDEDV